jgi:hypothetical protein
MWTSTSVVGFAVGRDCKVRVLRSGRMAVIGQAGKDTYYHSDIAAVIGIAIAEFVGTGEDLGLDSDLELTFDPVAVDEVDPWTAYQSE